MKVITNIPVSKAGIRIKISMKINELLCIFGKREMTAHMNHY